MNINFSKFKKVESDDKSTTLKHENGHLLKIAHKGLSREHLEELDKMPSHLAKGGKAKYSQMYDPNMKGSKASKPSASSNKMPGSPIEAKNMYTEPQDQGPDVVLAAMNKEAPPFGAMGTDPSHHQPPCINPSCKSQGRPHPNCRCYGGKMSQYGGYAEGGDVEEKHFCQFGNRVHEPECEYYSGGGMSGLASNSINKPPQDDSQDNSSSDQESAPQYNMTAPENLAQTPQEVNPNPEAGSTPDQASSTPDQKSDVDQPDEGQEAPASSMQTFQQHKQNDQNELFPEAQSFKADLDNGQIQPETYHDLFAKKDTLGKIGTLFGLMLGGAGAGLSHQPNMLMQMMDQTIDRDLKAQQESVQNKQNFLRINQQNQMTQAQAKNLTVDAQTKAWALAKTQMNWTALHSLVQNTNKLPEGPQKQQALSTLAMMNQGVQNENFNILDRAATASALSKTLMGQTPGQPGGNTMMMKSGLLGPEAKEIGTDVEQKTLPGIGVANRPVQQGDRDQILAMNVLDNKGKDLLNFIQQHQGVNLNRWAPATKKVALQKVEEMKNFYNNSIQGGALTEGRLGWYDEQFAKNPTDILPQMLGNTAKLKEMVNSNSMRKNMLLNSYGVKTPNQEQQQQNQVPTIATSKSGREIVHKNGKAYYK